MLWLSLFPASFQQHVFVGNFLFLSKYQLPLTWAEKWLGFQIQLWAVVLCQFFPGKARYLPSVSHFMGSGNVTRCWAAPGAAGCFCSPQVCAYQKWLGCCSEICAYVQVNTRIKCQERSSPKVCGEAVITGNKLFLSRSVPILKSWLSQQLSRNLTGRDVVLCLWICFLPLKALCSPSKGICWHCQVPPSPRSSVASTDPWGHPSFRLWGILLPTPQPPVRKMMGGVHRPAHPQAAERDWEAL